MSMHSIILIVVLNTLILPTVNGHGYMADPPNRASRWRYGFTGPKEYTDNQLSCGGTYVQWSKHGGKCGACGDEYGIEKPRFTYPGDFARNPPIVRKYTEGQKIKVAIKITANHKGYFVFRVAPLINPPIKQEDLDQTVLQMPNGDTEWKLLTSHGAGVFIITLQLPMGLSCKHCVLQWWWTTGNGPGPILETFVNCADIQIFPAQGPRPNSTPGPQTTAEATTKTCPPHNCPKPVVCPEPKPCPTQTASTQPTPCNCPKPVVCPEPKPCPTQATSTPSPRPRCRGTMPRYDSWCRVNCQRGFCPRSHCTCD